jgi:hypothetical protein
MIHSDILVLDPFASVIQDAHLGPIFSRSPIGIRINQKTVAANLGVQLGTLFPLP